MSASVNKNVAVSLGALDVLLDLIVLGRMARNTVKRQETGQLSFAALAVLDHLANTTDMSVTPSRLARTLGLSKGALTHILSGLERNRFVSRAMKSTDRRQLAVVLSVRGRRARDEVLSSWRSELEALSLINEEFAPAEVFLAALKKELEASRHGGPSSERV